MTLRTERQPDYVVVTLTGRLSLSSISTVRARLLKAVAEGPAVVVIDLTGLGGLDEVAGSLFLTVARQAVAWPGTRLVLCCPDPALRASLARLAVLRVLPVVSSREEAVAAGAPGPRRRDEIVLPSRTTAARVARRFVQAKCAEWGLGPDLADDAVLLADELVSNAAVHAGGAEQLRIELGPRYLTVAVRDADPTPPRHSAVPLDSESGRGIDLVDRLSAAWGVAPTNGGKATWFALPAGGAAPHRRRSHPDREP